MSKHTATRYYHYVPTAGGMAEEYATYSSKEKCFQHVTYDDFTGRTHTRFFSTLHDFIDWHYRSEGWDSYDEYSAEEVKVTLAQALSDLRKMR